VVGGGARNQLLCQLTAELCGPAELLAGPDEATALGNVLVQARAAGAIGGSLRRDARARIGVVRDRRYAPTASDTAARPMSASSSCTGLRTVSDHKKRKGSSDER
jgi:sugar (pentulose or hexulose) kinase